MKRKRDPLCAMTVRIVFDDCDKGYARRLFDDPRIFADTL